MKRALLGCCLVLLVVNGCGKDDAVRPPAPQAGAVVTALATGEPVAGVKTLLVDELSNAPLAGPLLTDAEGRVTFDVRATVGLRVLVFGGLDWRVHSQDDWFGWPPDGGKIENGAAKVIADGIAHIVLRAATGQDGLPRIEGLIVDAVTGLPLSQAVVATTPFLNAYRGNSDPGADVTGDDGAFVAQEILFALNVETGDVTMVEQLFVTRVGYRPRTWRYIARPGDQTIDIRGVEIPLTPLAAEDTGVLTGRILKVDGLPAPAVLVGLGGAADAKSGVGVMGQMALSDNDGYYTFSNLPAGRYVVDPGFRPYDGSVADVLSPILDVAADQVATMEDLTVLTEIIPVGGADRVFSRAADELILRWSPVAEAATYTVVIDGVIVGQPAGTDAAFPIPANVPTGLHSWWIRATAADDTILGEMQETAWFRLTD